MIFGAEAVARAGRNIFLERLNSALWRVDKTWAAQAEDERQAFLQAAWAQADTLGFRTERGVAGYALAARWMGLAFEQDVPLLMTLLKAPMPEPRKLHGLSDWVHDQLGAQATPASGDAAIRRSFGLTEAWGRHGLG